LRNTDTVPALSSVLICVCIGGFDHHCPWTSKCIGKKNLTAFYTFLTINVATFFYVLLFASIAAALEREIRLQAR